MKEKSTTKDSSRHPYVTLPHIDNVIVVTSDRIGLIVMLSVNVYNTAAIQIKSIHIW